MQQTQQEPIAILGMGCRFPGAENTRAFWRLLCEGRDAICEVPADRWDGESMYDRDLEKPGKMMSRWRSYTILVKGTLQSYENTSKNRW